MVSQAENNFHKAVLQWTYTQFPQFIHYRIEANREFSKTFRILREENDFLGTFFKVCRVFYKILMDVPPQHNS